MDYGIFMSPLGRLLVAGTDSGVCFVAMGDTEAEVEIALAGAFPASARHRSEDHISRWAVPIQEYLNGQSSRPDVPVDVRATAFQRRVWDLLRAIPPGETRTYGEIAQQMDRPRAVRAVARACGANPIALIIPCHRVIAKNGKLTGYRWGVQRKEALLRLERQAVAGMATG